MLPPNADAPVTPSSPLGEYPPSMVDGVIDAFQVADTVRSQRGKPEGTYQGEVASRLLEQIIIALEAELGERAGKLYRPYEWLFYLRRTPDDLFRGSLKTTAPYDRTLTETLVTQLGASEPPKRSLDDQGRLPSQREDLDRVEWACGFSKVVSQFHRHFRMTNKGGELVIGPWGEEWNAPFPYYFTRASDEVREAVDEFDRRVEQQKGGSPFGTRPTRANENIEALGVTSIALVQRQPSSTFVPAFKLDIPQDAFPAGSGSPVVHLRYATLTVDLGDFAEFLGHPLLGGCEMWHDDVPPLIGMLLFLGWMLSSPRSRRNIGQVGYGLIHEEQVETVWPELRAGFRESLDERFQPVVERMPESGRAFLDSLIEMTGTGWPLTPGPVACRVTDDGVALDFASASIRLLKTLQYPQVTGKESNVRADLFELQTQDAVDGTTWSPSSELKSLRGRDLKRSGETIGEVDALACRDGTLLLVSCKSILFTQEYDVGRYNLVRNRASRISDAVERWQQLVKTLRTARRGDNYDLTVADEIHGVVITPTVLYVDRETLKERSLPGLRYYSSFQELMLWLRAQ